MSEESILILNMLREGKITAEQADALLRAVRQNAPTPPPAAPIPPIPPAPGMPDPAALADMQRKLAELQSKLGEVQGKLGAAQAARAAGQAVNFAGKILDHVPRLEIDITKYVDEAMRGLNSFKNEAVRTARVAARQAAHEARRAARQSRKGFKWDFNFDFGDGGHSERPENATGQPQADETTQSSVSWTGADRLSLANNYGNISIIGQEGGEGAAQVSLTKTAWAGSDSEARVLLQQIFLTNRVENGQCRIEVVAPADARERITVDYEVRVPRGIALEVETRHGDIESDGASSVFSAKSKVGAIRARRPWGEMPGDTRLSNRSGDVTIEGWSTKGLLTVETASGDVQANGLSAGQDATLTSRSGDVRVTGLSAGGVAAVEALSGDVTVTGGSAGTRLGVKTQSGNVTVSGLSASQVTVETVSGDAQLSDVKGTLNVKTVSGDLVAEKIESPAVALGTVSGDARFTPVPSFSGSLAGTTVSGDLTLCLTGDTDARVELNTTSGDLSCDLALTERSPENERHLSGKAGAGTGSIRLQSVSGDLRVKAQ